MGAGVHPDRPGGNGNLSFDAIKVLKMKEQVVAVTVESFVKKVLAVDSQCWEDQAGALGRKIDYSRVEQTWKSYAGVLILQPDVHYQVTLDPVRSKKESNHKYVFNRAVSLIVKKPGKQGFI